MFWHLFLGNGTEFKIPSEIKTPLRSVKKVWEIFSKKIGLPRISELYRGGQGISKKIPDEIHLNSFLNYVAIWYEAIAQALNSFENWSYSLDIKNGI